MADSSMAGRQVILWEASEAYSITALVSREDHDAYISAIRALTEAETFGQLLSAGLPDWAERIIDEQREDLEDEGETVTGETPWVLALNDRDDEAYPYPWDWNHLTEAEWAAEVEDVLLAYGRIAGGPGYGDFYAVDDLEGLLATLSARGFILEQKDGLVAAYIERLLDVHESLPQPSGSDDFAVELATRGAVRRFERQLSEIASDNYPDADASQLWQLRRVLVEFAHANDLDSLDVAHRLVRAERPEELAFIDRPR